MRSIRRRRSTLRESALAELERVLAPVLFTDIVDSTRCAVELGDLAGVISWTATISLLTAAASLALIPIVRKIFWGSMSMLRVFGPRASGFGQPLNRNELPISARQAGQ